jgi:hypothetical protein
VHGEADERGLAGDVDDRAAARRAHQRDHAPAQQVDALHVDGEGEVPIGLGHLLQPARDRDAGVVDEHGRRAERARGHGDYGIDLLGVGHVARIGRHVARE